MSPLFSPSMLGGLLRSSHLHLTLEAMQALAALSGNAGRAQAVHPLTSVPLSLLGCQTCTSRRQTQAEGLHSCRPTRRHPTSILWSFAGTVKYQDHCQLLTQILVFNGRTTVPTKKANHPEKHEQSPCLQNESCSEATPVQKVQTAPSYPFHRQTQYLIPSRWW